MGERVRSGGAQPEPAPDAVPEPAPAGSETAAGPWRGGAELPAYPQAPGLWGRLQRARAGGAYERFVARTDRILLGLALVFLVVLLWPLLDTDLPPLAQTIFNWADVAIWTIFVLEYLTRLTLAPDRWRFVRTHLPDLVVVAVPPLRGLQVVIALLRVVGLVGLLGRLSRQSLHVRTGTYTAVLALGVLFVGAVSVFRVEKDAPEANITSFEDALWWALTTMTTVGYGDRFPVTSQGRLLAAVLMVSGIAILGVVTATIAAWFVSRFTAVDAKVEFVAEEVQQVERAVREVDADVDRVERTVGRIDDRVEAVEADELVEDSERTELLAAVRGLAARLEGLERAVRSLGAGGSGPRDPS